MRMRWDAVPNVWMKTIYQILMLWINCIIKNILVRHPLSFSATFLSVLRGKEWQDDASSFIPTQKVSSKLMTFLDSSALNWIYLQCLRKTFARDVSIKKQKNIYQIIMQHGVCALCLAISNLNTSSLIHLWGISVAWGIWFSVWRAML